MRYITLDDLIDYNECICDESDEESIIINENNLLSALSVQNSYFETDEETIAALFRSIIIGHGFQDGNKRTAVLCLLDAISNRNDSILTDDELENITIQIAEGKLSNPTNISKLLFGADFMKKYIKSFKTLEDKRDKTKGYKYVLKHGLGPGTIPRDVDIIKVEDGDYYDIVYLDRPLTKEELKLYDIPAEWEIDRYIKSSETADPYHGYRWYFCDCGYEDFHPMYEDEGVCPICHDHTGGYDMVSPEEDPELYEDITPDMYNNHIAWGYDEPDYYL